MSEELPFFIRSLLRKVQEILCQETSHMKKVSAD